MLKLVRDGSDSGASGGLAAGSSLLDEIVRHGAHRMLAAALQAKVTAYVDQFVDEVDARGHRLVVRNGYHEPREVVTAAGAVPVRQPRVNDKRVDPEAGERARFASAILPAWARKSPGVAEVLPLLYLHGLSSQDFGPALEQFLGSGRGLSATTITRLTTEWQTEAKTFNQRSLAESDYVYVWVDGIHLKVPLEQDKVCLLVIVGVRADGTKELVALDDGVHRVPGALVGLREDVYRCLTGWADALLELFDAVLCSPSPVHSVPGLSALRTPEQADRWTWLVIGTYTQLRQARGLVDDMRLPWERPRDPATLTPARVRRGFHQLRANIATPANPPKSTTPGPGRPKGTRRPPRTRYPAIKKPA